MVGGGNACIFNIMIFGFVVLSFVLFGICLTLGYIHLERENKRRWSNYARDSVRRVKALEARLNQKIADIPMYVAKKDNVAEMRNVDGRKNMESRYEELWKNSIVVGDEVRQVPKAS